MKNAEIASLFERLADVLEFKGDVVFKVNSYRKAARTLRDTPEDIEVTAADGRLEDLPGIGKATAQKIIEYLETGTIMKYESEREGLPDELLNMLQIPGLGPKSLALIHGNLAIETFDALEKAVESGAIAELPGMGQKRAESFLKGIQMLRDATGRTPLGEALPAAEDALDAVRNFRSVKRAELAGSLRRMRDTVGDIDILASAKNREAAIEAFTSMPRVDRVLAAGKTKASIIVDRARQIDLRVVDEESFGAALQYFTGSQAHNVKLRELAARKGLKLNEYGVFRGDEKLCGHNEADVYAELGLDWIPPELREDRGEIEAAAARALPNLVTAEQIKGDLHVHSNYSDGKTTLAELAERAKELDYRYVAVTDHSQSLKIARGLDLERLEEKRKEIARVNAGLKNLKLLFGTELDILPDGTLDYPDDILETFDWVVASIHSAFKQPRDKITQRIIGAMRNPRVDCIAHLTGRRIHQRPPYDVDIEQVLQVAAETGTAIEINANYERLDLDDVWCKRAKQLGVKLAIGTDSHRLETFTSPRLGIAVARRGWLEPTDVLNTLPLKNLLPASRVRDS